MKERIRLGLVGTGAMGVGHLTSMADVKEIELAGVCDIQETQVRQVAQQYGCPAFLDYRDFVRQEKIDAVLIATPHYVHSPVAVWAFEHGVHVLCEKPLTVTIGEAQKMIDAYSKHPELKFGIMFQSRLAPVWRQVKKLIAGGQLGKVFRVVWIITDWYRTQAYYNGGGWRGTWKGEGGGILMNQCPHQLDLWQWLFGMPEKVTALCQFGRHHQIEVEDDVTAFLEYADGMVGVFIASTGEFPGTRRLEISGDRGKVVVEKGKIHFERTVNSIRDHIQRDPPDDQPECWPMAVPVGGEDPGRKGVLRNFIQAVLGREELLVPGNEGIHSLMLANAMVYAGFSGRSVPMPLDATAYGKFLEQFVNKVNEHVQNS